MGEAKMRRDAAAAGAALDPKARRRELAKLHKALRALGVDPTKPEEIERYFVENLEGKVIDGEVVTAVGKDADGWNIWTVVRVQ